MFAQGKMFTNNQKKYNKRKHNYKLVSINQLNIVDKLSSNKFTNLQEAFIPKKDPLREKNLAETQKLQKLESEFNTDMNQYMEKYKLYLDELSSRQQSKNVKYRNQVITYDGNYYYVNNAGFARVFTNSVWQGKDNSCPQSSRVLSAEEFSSLTLGPPMNVGEMCRAGVYNAKSASDGTTAWVDNQGYKHIYTDFSNRHRSCPPTAETITSLQFNAMPTGKTYGSMEQCATISLDSPLYDQLMIINNRLLSKITEIKSEIGKLDSQDITLKNNIIKKKEEIVDAYSKLEKLVKQIKDSRTSIQTYRGEIEDQNLSVPSIQMHHLIWVVLGGAFIGAAIYNAS